MADNASISLGRDAQSGPAGGYDKKNPPAGRISWQAAVMAGLAAVVDRFYSPAFLTSSITFSAICAGTSS